MHGYSGTAVRTHPLFDDCLWPSLSWSLLSIHSSAIARMNGRRQAPVRLDPCDQGNDQSPRAVKIGGLRLWGTRGDRLQQGIPFLCMHVLPMSIRSTIVVMMYEIHNGDSSGLLTLDTVPSMGLRKSVVRNASRNTDLNRSGISTEHQLLCSSTRWPMTRQTSWTKVQMNPFSN